MSLDFCIPDLVASGALTRDQAAQVETLYGEFKSHYARTMGDTAAAAAATKETVAALERQAVKRTRNKLQQVQAQRAVALDLMKYGQGQGGLRKLDLSDPKTFGEAIMGLFYRRDQAPYMNVEFQQKVLLMRYQAKISGMLAKHSRNILGEVRAKADLDDLVDERFTPGSTGNANARELAEALGEVMEDARRDFNAAGGDIKKLDSWALPQSHDGVAIREAGFDAWFAAIAPRLDRTRIIDRATDAPFTDEAFDAVMRDVYEAIISDGWVGRMPTASFRGSSLSNRGMDHRFLHFKDGQAWREYNAQFGGTASPFDIINGHLFSMARDTALMQRFGPNPAATVRFLEQTMTKQVMVNQGKGQAEVANKYVREMNKAYKYLAGVDRAPVNRKLAMAFGTARNLEVASKLGSAALSMTSDKVTDHMTRKLNGLSNKWGIFEPLRMLNPLDKEHQMWAARNGIVNEEWAGMGATFARLEGGEISHEVSRRLAEGVLRSTGMMALTSANRRAFAHDFLNNLTTYAARDWDALPPNFANTLERYGMGPRDWDTIRATPREEYRGAQWIVPDNMNPQVRDRVMRMIYSETDRAVPVPSAEWAADLQANAPSGTLPGELIKSAAQFKSFTIDMWREQVRRSMAMTRWNGAAYAAQMFIGLTLAGALALQMKEVAKGKQFRPVYDEDDPAKAGKFWVDAMFQGGGFGIMGDVVNQSLRGQFGGAAATATGPLFSSFDQLVGKPIGLLYKDATRTEEQKPANWGKWATDTIRKEMPGSNIWYTRAAFERVILDSMQAELDPNWEQSVRDMQRRAEKEGGGYVWAPGDGVQKSGQLDVNALVGDAPIEE